METPYGYFPAPMSPAFTTALAKCEKDEDLFALVEENGFINPDAFNEVNARGLYFKYKEWKTSKSTIN